MSIYFILPTFLMRRLLFLSILQIKPTDSERSSNLSKVTQPGVGALNLEVGIFEITYCRELLKLRGSQKS